VEQYLNDHTFLHRNYKKSKKTLSKDEREQQKVRLQNVRQAAQELSSGQLPAKYRNPDMEEAEHEFDFMAAHTEHKAEEDIIMENLMDRQHRPWFSIFQIVVCFLPWLCFSIYDAIEGEGDVLRTKAGLESIFPGKTQLEIYSPECKDLRIQMWRWATYQFTHVGFTHVFFNCLLVALMSIPLEGVYGHLRMCVMFNVGVVGAAMFYFVTDCHAIVVGCSGGCYALIGMHLADCIMNWADKKFRWPTLGFLALIILMDVLSYLSSVSDENTSHSAHIGGGLTGLIIGIILAKNLEEHWCEKVILMVAVIVGLSCMVFSLVYLSGQNDGAQNIFEANSGIEPWCWYRQVFDYNINPKSFVCIRCGTQECIDSTSIYQVATPVEFSACNKLGWYVSER